MSIGCTKVAMFNPGSAKSTTTAILDRWVVQPDQLYAGRHGNDAARSRSLMGRCLVRALVDSVTGTDGRGCRIDSDSNGRPHVTLASGERGPFISVSHSAEMVVAAATDLGPLGIDVEYRRTDRSFRELAAFAFGKGEQRSSAGSREGFYRIWTLREAMGKATGRGLVEAADGVDRITDGPRIGAWETAGPATPSGTHWFLAHIEPAPDYSMALAIRRDRTAQPFSWSMDSIEWCEPAPNHK